MWHAGKTALGTAVVSGVAMAMVLTGCKAPGESNADDKGGGPRDEFAQAASALRDAPQFGYHMRTAGLAMEIRATREGAAIGAMTLAGARTNVLPVGGKTYMRWHKAIPGAPSRPGQADLLKDKWVTGSALSGMGRTLTPKQLGMTVAQELNQPGTRYPDRGEDGHPTHPCPEQNLTGSARRSVRLLDQRLQLVQDVHAAPQGNRRLRSHEDAPPCRQQAPLRAPSADRCEEAGALVAAHKDG